jgi:glycerate kinase
MRIVLAPDKFKGSLTAAEVSAAIGAGLRRVLPEADLAVQPVADGGDGTIDALTAAGYSRVELGTVGPTGQPLRTAYALRGDEAVVELAAVVGLGRLPDGKPRPLDASTYGFGLLVADAIKRGATRVVLGVGGSASTDGGMGMVEALGARALTASGSQAARGGRGLASIRAVEVEELAKRIDGIQFVVASDVDNPLLGDSGAAAVFAPQKGAGPTDVEALAEGLANWARVVTAAGGRDVAGSPGAGAAGGTAYAAMSLLGAAVVPGIELVLDRTGFDQALSGARIVITGEGSLDVQTLGGKAPAGVAARASRRGLPVVAVAGRSGLTDEQLQDLGIARVYVLSALEPDASRSMTNAAGLLERIGEQIAREWLA